MTSAGKGGKTESREAEAVALLEVVASDWRRDMTAVIVVRLPLSDVGEVGPNLGGCDVAYNYFIGDIVVGGSGQKLGRPNDC